MPRRPKPLSTGQMRSALDSWHKLDRVIMRLGETQTQQLLEIEIGSEDRSRFKRRLYGHFARLRSERERKDIGI